MVFIRAAEAKDIPSLQTLFAAGLSDGDGDLSATHHCPAEDDECAGGGNRKRRVWRNRYQFYFTGT